MKQDKHLDEQIRQALQSLEASADPLAWGVFEQKLDAAEKGNRVDWDDAVRQRLTGLEVPALAGDWNFMESRLDAEDAAEQIENEATIDNLAYEKLSELTARYHAAHWRLMSERLEKEFSLRYTLYKYKVMEAAALLLLLLTIVRVAPLAEGFFRQRDAAEPSRQIQAAPAPQADAPANSQSPAQLGIAPAATNNFPGAGNAATANSSSIQANSSVVANNFSNPAPTSSNGNLLAGTSQTGTFFSKPGQKKPAKTQMPTIGNGLTDTSVSANSPANTASTGLPFLPLDEVKPLATQALQLENVRLPDSRMLASAAPPAQVEVPKTKPVASDFGWETPTVVAHPLKKSNRQLRFTILTTSDLNIVTTPPDHVSISDTLVATDPNRSWASGYGGGIWVSLKSNRLEFQTGGVYSFKRYMPGTSDFLWESVKYYVKEGFDGIQLDIFQMPLHLQYHLKNSGNWRMYASGGVSGQVVTSSVHEFGKPKALPLIVPQFGQEVNRTIRQEEELKPGILNGGNLYDNFYLTGNLGFGIERFVSPRWSLFFQPNYQHNLMSEGIGVNKDKIYSLSFYLGTKVSLK